MKIFSLSVLVVIFAFPVMAQKEDKAIKKVIETFFEAMETRDTATLRSTCMPKPVFQTFMKDKSGKMEVFEEDFEDFLQFVGSPSTDKFKEEIKFQTIASETSLASVWTPYTFYLNGKVSHCGTNSFQLVKTDTGWKIQYIIDTRRKGCK